MFSEDLETYVILPRAIPPENSGNVLIERGEIQ